MEDIFVIIILILVNGFLSMSEVALISVRKSALADDIKRGSKSAKKALQLAEEPDKFLSIVQIGITLIGILTGIYSGDVLAEDFSLILSSFGISEAYSLQIAQIIIVIVVTYFTIIIGELIPKRIGMILSKKIVITIALPIYALSILSSPFVWVLSKSTSGILKLLNLNTKTATITESEIREMINIGTLEGEVQIEEQDIIDRVFLLGDMNISSLMIHRSEIKYIDVNLGTSRIRQIIKEHFHDIYPVTDGNLDNILGIIYLKELLFKIDEEDFNITKLIKKEIYFHENLSIYKALKMMREEKINHAFICDEYGSCQGLVTLNDIFKGIMYAMNDPISELDIIRRNDRDEWEVDGQCPFCDFLSYFDREDLSKNNKQYNTIAGLILSILKRVPNTGDSVYWHEFRFEIIQMDRVRIDKVLVTIEQVGNTN